MKYIHINIARHKLWATSYISTESTDYYSYVHIQENPRLINDYSQRINILNFLACLHTLKICTSNIMNTLLPDTPGLIHPLSPWQHQNDLITSSHIS